LVVRLRLLREAFAADREGRAVHRRLAWDPAENGADERDFVTDRSDWGDAAGHRGESLCVSRP